ncbi:unnamed protein product [Cochlearia groenlandica]
MDGLDCIYFLTGVSPYKCKVKSTRGKGKGGNKNEESGESGVDDETLKASKAPLETEEHDWSIIVPPGRFISVDPGDGNLLRIKEACFYQGSGIMCYQGFNQSIFEDKKTPAKCQLYLGINRTKEEFVIGFLDSLSHPLFGPIDPLIFKEKVTLGHNGSSSVRFTVSKSGPPPPLPRRRQTRRLRRKSIVNVFSWPLTVDLTAKVMSMLGNINEVAKAELVCKHFYRAGHSPAAYRSIDITKNHKAEDLTVHMLMRRAHGQLESLAVGCYDDFNSNPTYTARLFEPIPYFGFNLTGSIGFTTDIADAMNAMQDVQPELPELNIEFDQNELDEFMEAAANQLMFQAEEEPHPPDFDEGDFNHEVFYYKDGKGPFRRMRLIHR